MHAASSPTHMSLMIYIQVLESYVLSLLDYNLSISLTFDYKTLLVTKNHLCAPNLKIWYFDIEYEVVKSTVPKFWHQTELHNKRCSLKICQMNERSIQKLTSFRVSFSTAWILWSISSSNSLSWMAALSWALKFKRKHCILGLKNAKRNSKLINFRLHIIQMRLILYMIFPNPRIWQTKVVCVTMWV